MGWKTSACLLSVMLFGVQLLACREPVEERSGPLAEALEQPPTLVLVTLDTTRADAVGYANKDLETPALDALAKRGVVFNQAYTTAPMTLPAHASMFTGQLPSSHGVHENARYLRTEEKLLAERLRQLGYRTAAFVSGFPLRRQFGLARGFELYDDDFGGAAERDARATTDRALAFLQRHGQEPLFLWLHYFDAHDPYRPPEPFRSRYAAQPYLGEIAYLDSQLGRLIEALELKFGQRLRLLVVGDHGEGLGDHGEALHGHLLYQGVMRVPLVVVGGVQAAQIERPVSTRRVFDTLLGWATGEGMGGLLDGVGEVVLGEAMKPYLQYGWQPQVMAVDGSTKAIRSDRIEIFDVARDPLENRDLAPSTELSGRLRRALTSYPLPTSPGPAGEISAEDREQLASLGYVGGGQAPGLPRAEAPAARDMTRLFADLDLGAGLFIARRYAEAVPVFERLAAADGSNPTTFLRLAVAHSALGEDHRAQGDFERARRIDPSSLDLRHYQALHHLRMGRWSAAEPLLVSVVAEAPKRLPALAGLAAVRERQGRQSEAAELLQRVTELDPRAADAWLKLGQLRMGEGSTPLAVDALERASELDPENFPADLELAVLYMASGRLQEASERLDRVRSDSQGWPMALFKRAQISVLLGDSDSAERIGAARRHADAVTGPLIEREALFRAPASAVN